MAKVLSVVAPDPLLCIKDSDHLDSVLFKS